MPDTPTAAVFPGARERAGMYESFYLRAVSPDRPVGAWIRHTAHKRTGEAPRGSVWVTLFDVTSGAPFMHKYTTDALNVPTGGWIEIGAGQGGADAEQAPVADGGIMSPGLARGRCGPARWDLRWESHEPELRHLGAPLLYRAPLPRTKLTSPAPSASFSGTIEIAGRPAILLDGWHGMVGHNWGAEHAERWIWLHGVDFAGTPGAWLDIALGRVRVGKALTPWVANGAMYIDGHRHRVGGLGARGTHVREDVHGCALQLGADGGLRLEAQVLVPDSAAAGWRYSDPDGSEHDVVNCSVAELEVDVRVAGDGRGRLLHTPHGGAYELGMREHDHGVPLAPFPDG